MILGKAGADRAPLQQNKFKVMDTLQHNFIGDSPAIAKALQFAGKAARSSAPVLIQGESGTGKGILARVIHQNGPRRQHRCVAVNCATLTGELLVSELFGHERGSFTGADRQKLGKFELADKGTLFLDEIGEMHTSIQPKLLRALEEGEIDRLGGRDSIVVDVRVIAATNRDLKSACKRGEFRRDLYYRLNVLPITIPPLRDRREDISALIRYFISKFGDETEPPVTGISPEAEAMLRRYDWPGNVRELRNVIHRAILLGSGGIIRVQDLEGSLEPDGDPLLDEKTLDGAVLKAMRRCLLEAYEEAQGNREKMGRIIGRHPNNIPRLLEKFGLGHLKNEAKRQGCNAPPPWEKNR